MMSGRSTLGELSPILMIKKTGCSIGNFDSQETVTDYKHKDQYENHLSTYPTSSIHKIQSYKTQQKLFIGGISLSVDLSHLEHMLSKVIHARGTLRINMAKQNKVSSYSGYGQISSTKNEDLEKLLELKNIQYKDSWIGIKPYLTKKNEIKQLKSDKDLRKIHIKGINFRVSEEDLEDYFRCYGPINHIQINKNLSTGTYKGFAFIEFEDESSVRNIINKSTHVINGVSLFCERSKAKNIDSNNHNNQKPISSYSLSYPNTINCSNKCLTAKNTTRSILSHSKLNLIESNHFSENVKFNMRYRILANH